MARFVNPRTERLLAAPIVPALLRLSAPGVLLVLFQSMVSVGDTYFVGRLGTEPLAGLALVFPLIMLLQMNSAGAMGGGVSSAIARALGSADGRLARRLVVHALAIALAMGALFTIVILAFGDAMYRLLGGSDDTLAQALAYSQIVFGGAVAVWIANTLSSVLRGTGNMLAPAATLIAAATIHLPLSGWLVARIGIAGAAIAYVTTFAIAALVMAMLVWRSALRPRRGDWTLEWHLFREILRVGAISMLSALQTVLTAVIITGFVGRYGAAALAGYGVGLRLELLQFPLVWVGLFSADPAVLESGSRYLRTVAPFYPFLAAGIALYFASQGAGRVLRPVLAGTVRLVLVIAGGLAAVSLQGVFMVIAAAMIAFGALTLWFVATAKWK